jgi:hypothetical protein
MSVQVLDRCPVAPSDILAVETERRRDSVSLRGTRRPAAVEDRLYSTLVQPSLAGELTGVQSVLGTQFRKYARRIHDGSSGQRDNVSVSDST